MIENNKWHTGRNAKHVFNITVLLISILFFCVGYFIGSVTHHY